MAARLTVYPAQVRQQVTDTTLDDRVDIAKLIVAEAQPVAPVDTGYFQSQFDVETEGSRVFAVNSADDASYIEFGTLDTPPAAVMTDAARNHGKYSGWVPR
ncbi:HK97 gp10 family phage protein [Rhodococcus sp. 14-2470-1a]|uniref:HK97 gp10 family phage protein n=1 Tax=Rhodococcus sp. 14-2470-1a TaxID=2023150 RepID=UPI000B9ABEFA|nr:HK97 gp10 family phage protein [Rhodococcus sp. 14-2470-1a]OZF47570.1 hypothetical protein CH292_19290 [Rhodococcus sp. 14-2470-1a]